MHHYTPRTKSVQSLRFRVDSFCSGCRAYPNLLLSFKERIPLYAVLFGALSKRDFGNDLQVLCNHPRFSASVRLATKSAPRNFRNPLLLSFILSVRSPQDHMAFQNMVSGIFLVLGRGTRMEDPCVCTILYYTILYYTILYYTILYYTILYYTILYYTILYYTILYYTILYYIILYYTVLYCTVLY